MAGTFPADIFVRHRNNGSIIRVTVSSSGVQANADSELPSIDSTGAYVVYGSFASNLVAGDTHNANDIIRYDLTTGQTCRFSVATGGGQGTSGPNGASQPAIDSAGHRITYAADFANLVSGDGVLTSNIFQTVDHGGTPGGCT